MECKKEGEKYFSFVNALNLDEKKKSSITILISTQLYHPKFKIYFKIYWSFSRDL